MEHINKLGAFAGSWLVDALTENKGQHAVPEQSVTLADGQTVAADFIVAVTPPPVTIDPSNNIARLIQTIPRRGTRWWYRHLRRINVGG